MFQNKISIIPYYCQVLMYCKDIKNCLKHLLIIDEQECKSGLIPQNGGDFIQLRFYRRFLF